MQLLYLFTLIATCKSNYVNDIPHQSFYCQDHLHTNMIGYAPYKKLDLTQSIYVAPIGYLLYRNKVDKNILKKLV